MTVLISPQRPAPTPHRYLTLSSARSRTKWGTHDGYGALEPHQANTPAEKPDGRNPAVSLAGSKPNPVSPPSAITALAQASPPALPPDDRPASPSASATDGAAPPTLPGQGRRVALVIGNSAYKDVDRLPNPDLDAEAMAAALRLDGFNDVKLLEDASLQQLREAFLQFQIEVDDADWAVVYYAGHGIQVSGQNFLIPVDAHLQTDRNISDETISLDYVLDKISNARRLRVVILDACRNNPFTATMKRRIAMRGVSRGFSPYEPVMPSELVVYSAKAGEEAMDGDGTSLHSPFTQALLARMAMPGIEINKMLRMITTDVLTKTKGQQQPFVYGSTPGNEDFYFKTN